MSNKVSTRFVVIGSGPGGYAAAFRLADLTRKESSGNREVNVVLIEKHSTLGGVCLNVGCIPSKALLHMAEVVNSVEEVSGHGLTYGKPKIDVKKIVDWKDSIISHLTQGLKGLARQRKVKVLHGEAQFIGPNQIQIKGDSDTIVDFDKAIIASGSENVNLPFIPQDDPRILDSTTALNLSKTNGKLAVLGGGIIGCEMATVYRALGAEVDVIEMLPQIMPGADVDLVRPCQKIMEKRGVKFYLSTQVSGVKAGKNGLTVSFKEGQDKVYDQMLVSVGRRPKGADVGAEHAGVKVDERGFIPVDECLTTNQRHIYAIGDVCGNPMLAHKAAAEGRLVAEVVHGKRVKFDAQCIPSVAYTDPEVSWVGKTEAELKKEGIAYDKGVFPWAASGRSLCLGRSEGLTKLLACKESGRVLGGGVVGKSAGDIISEVALAIEMGCYIEDIELTIHPHPTLSETIGLAAEACMGTITDLYMPKD
ncbi:MAG TPA: dihydrolipoyl dehydrogenase [Gammaproteobacteria bacterium]|nr:dihydrolipoyl dehydrogenase [Gammaproteobacteria bacterium]